MEIQVPSLEHLISSYLMCCQAEGKSPKTIDWYGANLRRFCNYLKSRGHCLQIEKIGVSEVREFIYYLQNDAIRWVDSKYVKDDRNLSPFSVQGYARSIKAFWSWLNLEGYTDQNVMQRLRLPKVPQKVVATFTSEQIGKLISILDLKTTTGYRDYLILLMLLDTGIRLSELVGLCLEDVDFEQSCLLVTGKGSRERIVPFGARVRRSLWRYVSHFRKGLDGLEAHEIFVSERGYALQPRAVQSLLKRLGERAGICGVRCSAHTFRHSFAKQYLMYGGDVFSLQRILGHSSLEVVKMYVNLASNDIFSQHRKFSPVDNMYVIKGRHSDRILSKHIRYDRECQAVKRKDTFFNI